ncbi:MAG: glutamyl-tRNA reductase, partial [Lysobacterales bacterium]
RRVAGPAPAFWHDMTLIALGLNHQTAPLELRERVAFPSQDLGSALRALAAQAGVREAAILSTCNRTELYCHVDVGSESMPGVWMKQHYPSVAARLDEFLYRHTDAEAVRHVFRVATGLDSMILGEPQILGQVKQAWQAARDAQALDSTLDRMFQHTFAVAKRVRTETQIGAHPVSVAFAAVRLAQQLFAEPKSITALLIGAGDTIELAARHLYQAGTARILIANRTLANAELLAASVDAEPLSLDHLDRHLAQADLVLSSTSSAEYLIHRDQVARALRLRRRRPMLLIDLAVPRDIDPKVAELEDAYLYSIDDLGRVIEGNLNSRREAAQAAEAIIALHVEHFMSWQRTVGGLGPVRQLRAQGEAARDQLLAEASAQLIAGRDPAATLQWLAHTLTGRLLHAPTANLRAAAARGDVDLLRASTRLFESTVNDAAEELSP